MTVPIIIITLALLLAFMRPFTTLFHELGHGITALLLTKEKVSLYIGNYGNPDQSFILKIKKLELFFLKNPFNWRVGLCIYNDKNVSFNKKIFITLMGPVASLLLGFLSFYLALTLDLHGIVKVLSFVLLSSSLYDFFSNIIPQKDPIQLYDGSIAYNDGQQLIMLFMYKALPSKYEIGVEYYNNQNYKKAAKVFHSIIKNGWKKEIIYRHALASYLQDKNYKTALELNKEFVQLGGLNSDDYVNSGLIKSQLGFYQESLIDLQKSLDLNPDNKYALNNRGYTYNLMHQYDKAILDLDMSIALDPKFSYSFNNRGLAKMELGLLDEGLNDIEKSLDLDDENSYAYRNLGIYYFKKSDFNKALEQFKKAYELDQDTSMLIKYIEKTRSELRMK